MPKISVICGAYNAASHPMFERSVESILNQSFTDFEFIICDDGSTDGTYKALVDYSKRDSRIKVLKNEKNLGLAKALNRCLDIAKGDYIARQDLDDCSDTKRFKIQLDYLERNRDTAFLGTSVYLFDGSGILGLQTVTEKPKERDFLFNNPYKHGSVIFRREAILQANGYNTSKKVTRCEDYELFMRMHLFCRGANLTLPLYYFCEDRAARKRRKYVYRINEARVRYHGFKALGLMPWAFPYVIKPLVVGLLPHFVITGLRNIKKL